MKPVTIMIRNWLVFHSSFMKFYIARIRISRNRMNKLWQETVRGNEVISLIRFVVMFK